jgi:DNA-binding response OmpR family regulator
MSKAAKSGGKPSATVLVVDDDPAIVGLLETRLSSTGYRVLTAADGEEALQQARDESPDLVVLDVMMPKMNGWEVARALRHDDDTRDIKIVMLTAIGPQVNEMTSPLYGADAYIDKPFEFGELEAIIQELLS